MSLPGCLQIRFQTDFFLGTVPDILPRCDLWRCQPNDALFASLHDFYRKPPDSTVTPARYRSHTHIVLEQLRLLDHHDGVGA